MRDASETVDAYLTSRFGIGLEQLLADATSGELPCTLARSITLACDPVGAFDYEDGGTSKLYQGLLRIEGVTYRFRCAVFTDAGGGRFVESVSELQIVDWNVRLLMPDVVEARSSTG